MSRAVTEQEFERIAHSLGLGEMERGPWEIEGGLAGMSGVEGRAQDDRVGWLWTDGRRVVGPFSWQRRGHEKGASERWWVGCITAAVRAGLEVEP
jgi:hypothetical protein